MSSPIWRHCRNGIVKAGDVFINQIIYGFALECFAIHFISLEPYKGTTTSLAGEPYRVDKIRNSPGHGWPSDNIVQWYKPGAESFFGPDISQ